MKTDLQNRHYKKMGQQQLTFIQGMIPQNYHLTTIKAEVVEIQKTKNDNAIKGKISVSSILGIGGSTEGLVIEHEEGTLIIKTSFTIERD